MPTKQITLDPGKSGQVSFSYTPMEARVYSVPVNGLLGSFKAIAMPPAYHYIHLVGGEAPEGWNEIIYDGKSGDVVTLTANIINLSMVYYYTGSEWLFYNPDWPLEMCTLRTLKYGKTYPIHTKTTQDWQVPNP